MSPSFINHSAVSDVDLARVGSLDDPTRRRVYLYVAEQTEPVSRDQAASSLDLGRSTVAYHLDKLVEVGLLTASFARPSGRGGPGAGRPTKRYERVGGEIALSLPPRDYRLVAEILARAIQTDTPGALLSRIRAAAAEAGLELAREFAGGDPHTFLAQHGFEPRMADETVQLRNCPFHLLAQEHRELICGLNLALVTAAVHRIDSAVRVELDPSPDRCCVVLRP